DRGFLMVGARTVEPKQPAQGDFSAEVLFEANGEIASETDLRTEATALARDLRTPERLGQVRAQLQKGQPSVAVSVTTPRALPQDNDPHAMLRHSEREPRMVVFGDATWVTNRYVTEGVPFNFPVFASTLSWLRERADIGTKAEAK